MPERSRALRRCASRRSVMGRPPSSTRLLRKRLRLLPHPSLERIAGRATSRVFFEQLIRDDLELSRLGSPASQCSATEPSRVGAVHVVFTLRIVIARGIARQHRVPLSTRQKRVAAKGGSGTSHRVDSNARRSRSMCTRARRSRAPDRWSQVQLLPRRSMGSEPVFTSASGTPAAARYEIRDEFLGDDASHVVRWGRYGPARRPDLRVLAPHGAHPTLR
jgi:hypothetical protein